MLNLSRKRCVAFQHNYLNYVYIRVCHPDTRCFARCVQQNMKVSVSLKRRTFTSPSVCCQCAVLEASPTSWSQECFSCIKLHLSYHNRESVVVMPQSSWDKRWILKDARKKIKNRYRSKWNYIRCALYKKRKLSFFLCDAWHSCLSNNSSWASRGRPRALRWMRASLVRKHVFLGCCSLIALPLKIKTVGR